MVYACVLPVDPTVCSLSHPQAFLMFFFLRYYTLFTFVWAEIQSLSMFVWSKIQSVTFHRAIVTLQASYSSWRRVSLLSLTAFATPAAPPINDPSAPNIGKIRNIPPHFAVGSTRFFRCLFLSLHFRLHTHADLCFSFHCRPNGSLSVSRISRYNTFPRFLSKYFVGVSARSLLCE